MYNDQRKQNNKTRNVNAKGSQPLFRGSGRPSPHLTAHLALRADPGVLQTLGSRGSPLRLQLQHGEEEGAEAGRGLLAPLVLVHQDVHQAPRGQLGDVP